MPKRTMTMPNKRAKRWTQLDQLLDEYAKCIRYVENTTSDIRMEAAIAEDNARGAITDFLRGEGL